MFHGLLIVLIPIGLIWALIVFPALRIAVVIFVLVVCAIGYGMIQIENKNAALRAEKAIADAAADEKASEARRQRVQKAKDARWSLVKIDQVQIRDAALKSKSFETFDAIVSVFNGSRMRVNAIEAAVTLYDCRSISNSNQTKNAAVKQNCEIIGETNHIFEGSIPPSQIRALKGELQFKNLPQARGNATYNFAVMRVKANANPKSTEFDDTVEELDDIFGLNE
jgi:hypothetical protein